MAIEHILTDMDSMQSLAYQYFADATRWQEIVDYNSLEYPYILTSEEQRKSLHASGYLKVTRDLFTSALTIYAGSLFSTKNDNQGIQRFFEVVEDTTIPAGQASGYVYVRCTQYGTFGNVISHSVTQAFKVNTNLGISLSSLLVDNEMPFVGGTDATVKITGEPIYIPSSAEDNDIQGISSVTSYLNLLGGEDFELDAAGDITTDGLGDIGTVVGLANIAQAVKHRLMTEVGSLPHHPEYGTRLTELIGKANLPYIQKLMELDISESLSYDALLSGVTINVVSILGTSVYVDMTHTINNVGETVRLQVDLTGGV